MGTRPEPRRQVDLTRAPLHAPRPADRLWILYVDESGVPERHPSQAGHFVLAGAAIPATSWASKARDIETVRGAFGVEGEELHVAWLLRPYPEQAAIPDFDTRDHDWRRARVRRARAATLHRLKALGNMRVLGETKRSFARTTAYVHLTFDERRSFVREVADVVGAWDDVRIFAEVFDKAVPFGRAIEDEAYEQVVSRFEAFLGRVDGLGVVAYDQNESVVRRILRMTADLQAGGGTWRRFHRLAGHPFFVASHLSDMIQVADLVSYALRRYADRNETDLYLRLAPRFDRIGEQLVGLRHYRGGRQCRCAICAEPRVPR